MKKVFLASLFLLSLTINSYAKEKIEPSFDCKKASTKVEKMICSDAELAKSDKELNELYNKYIEFISNNLPNYKDIVIKAQRNWMRERNKIMDIQNLKVHYNRIIYELGDAFNPGYSPAGLSDYDDEDVAYYWKYKPISFYFMNGYVRDAKKPVYVLYNNDAICQNLSSLKIIDFNEFISKAEPLKEYYQELSDGSMQKTTLLDGVNFYLAKYNNGYFGLRDGKFPLPLKYLKKNEKGYYEPFIKRKSYGYEYKSIPEDLVWSNIVRMQQDEPLNDMGDRQSIYTFSLPVVHNNNMYIKELTIYNDIEYYGIDYDKNPPVYDKSVVIKVESPLVRIFSYNNDGSRKLACVYTENKDSLNKQYKSFFRKYSDYEAAMHIAIYLDKPIKFSDYLDNVEPKGSETPYIKQTLKDTEFTEAEAVAEVKRQIDYYLAWEKGKTFKPDECQAEYETKCSIFMGQAKQGDEGFEITKTITKFKSYEEFYNATKQYNIYYEYEIPAKFPAKTTMYENIAFVYYKGMVGIGVFGDDTNFRHHDSTKYALVDFELYRKTSNGFVEHIDDGKDFWFNWRY